MAGFVTYAQNFEDLMLWRALHDVERGFYIDVGAADPVEDSATFVFYKHGWTGINIEPAPDHFAALQASRPHDRNLMCLVGSVPGTAELKYFPQTGLSTTDAKFARQHVEQRGYELTIVERQVRTLADICAEYVTGDIHFLKIDVEGAERDVLRGADFSRWRPWIVLAEATEPNSVVENWQDWEPLLIDADYRFVWFDGLNRFYVAGERIEQLGGAFHAPPNVFDKWSLPAPPAAPPDIASLQAQVAALQAAEEARQLADRRRGENEAARVVAADSYANAEAARILAEDARRAAEWQRREAEQARQRAEQERHGAEAARNHAENRRESQKRTEASACEDASQARIRELEDALRTSQAHCAALLASSSWRVTAPARQVARFVKAPGAMLIPREDFGTRILQVAGTDASAAKRVARVGAYGAARICAHVPGGRALTRRLERTAPGLYGWLQARYGAYRRSYLGDEEAAPGGHYQEVQAELPSVAPDIATQPDISAEEDSMLTRLRSWSHFTR